MIESLEKKESSLYFCASTLLRVFLQFQFQFSFYVSLFPFQSSNCIWFCFCFCFCRNTKKMVNLWIFWNQNPEIDVSNIIKKIPLTVSLCIFFFSPFHLLLAITNTTTLWPVSTVTLCTWHKYDKNRHLNLILFLFFDST